jgi:predicted nucleic acid-binding protein
MDKVLVDTDILSDFLRGKNASVLGRAQAYVADRQRLTLSVVTVFEIVRGRHHAGQAQRAATFLEWTIPPKF